jgi:sortase A
VTTVDAGTSDARSQATGTEDAGTKDGGTEDAGPPREPVQATRAPEAQQPQPVWGHPLRATVGVLMLAVLFCVGFFVYLYGFSGISESRAQTGMFKNFVAELSQATAPVGPTVENAADTAVIPVAEGAPVAVLNIPQIGLRDVVVVNATRSIASM